MDTKTSMTRLKVLSLNAKSILFGIFLLALFLRIAFIIFYDGGKMLKNEFYAADSVSYDTIAMNLLNGKGFVYEGLYARRGPAYPLFLALVYLIFGHSLVAVRFVEAVIGSLTCVVVYLLGKGLFDRKVGVVASFISAVYYPFILQPAYLLTEVLFTFLVMVIFFCLISYYNGRKYYFLVSAGLTLGVSVLCKGVLFPFLPLLMLWLMIIECKQIKRGIIASMTVFIFAFLPMAPWIVRNYMVYDAFVPSQVGGGPALYIGNNPKATGGTGGWHNLGQDSFFPEHIPDVFTPQGDVLAKKEALNYIMHNPRRFIVLGFKKMINMWRPFYADARLLNKLIMSILYIPIMILAFVGIFLTRKRWMVLLIFYFLFIYYIMVHVILFGEIRYRYPVMPFFIVFAAYSLVFLLEYFSHPADSIRISCKPGVITKDV